MPSLSYGWPVTWYWCDLRVAPPPVGMTPKLVEWSGSRLAGNLAIWFVIFASLGMACQCLLRCFCPPIRYRPRVLTLMVLTAVVGLIVLANMSCDQVMLDDGSDFASLWRARPFYGWPLIWRWHITIPGYGAPIELDQNYSAAHLTGNLAIWLVMLGAAAVACERFLRRHRPRLRWSLRTMLAMIGLVAAICAWCAALRDRADAQDPIISAASIAPRRFDLHLEYAGPKWLHFVGAGRSRRREMFQRRRRSVPQ
ncbi:MAG TPA: hypothetical protein VGX78_21175 [Pirellulales bacterium]|nr:hypothetical protein [Pirellulales bacterium]